MGSYGDSYAYRDAEDGAADQQFAYRNTPTARAVAKVRARRKALQYQEELLRGPAPQRLDEVKVSQALSSLVPKLP